jgi:hypothetical protein
MNIWVVSTFFAIMYNVEKNICVQIFIEICIFISLEYIV